LDAVVLPSDFMDTVIAELYARDRELILKKFKQLGRDVAKYLKVHTESFEELLQLARTVGRFFLVGAGSRVESTQCVYEAMKGILEEYGVKILEDEVAKGLIKAKVSTEK
jgi:hypothetical protein